LISVKTEYRDGDDVKWNNNEEDDLPF
jgi:hypothetical protein